MREEIIVEENNFGHISQKQIEVIREITNRYYWIFNNFLFASDSAEYFID
ncbi:hypothetical protein AAC978_10650 [Desulfitobacterium sp. THU1]